VARRRAACHPERSGEAEPVGVLSRVDRHGVHQPADGVMNAKVAIELPFRRSADGYLPNYEAGVGPISRARALSVLPAGARCCWAMVGRWSVADAP